MIKHIRIVSVLSICLLSLQINLLKAESNGPCAIEDLTIELIDCNADGTYNVELYYTILNPVGDTLSLFINSELHDDYVIGGSLTVNNVEPSDLFETDIFFLCMKEDEDCYASLDYAHPECLCEGPCEVEDIQVLILECDASTNTYTAQIFYTISNSTHEDVEVSINNEYYGSFPIGESIIVEGIIPRPDTDYDIVQICASDECCGVFEFLQEDCFNNNDPCNIYDIEIVDFICSPAGTYSAIWLEYEVTNPLDSIIYVALNGDPIGGWNVGEQISFDVPQDAQTFVITLFFDGTDCLTELDIENICGECNWGDIELNGIECLENEYFALLNYFISNPPFDEVYLAINGAGEGAFPVNEPIAFEGVSSEVIEVYMYFYSEATDTICEITQEFKNPCFECDNGCLQGQLDYVYECYENQGGYYLEIEPLLECGPDSLDLLITINDQITGAYNSSQNWIFDFVPINPSSDFFTVEVCYQNNPGCCILYEFLQPDCEINLPCSIDSADVYLNCVNDNQYYLEGYALVTNYTDDNVDVWIDSIYAGSYEISQNGFVDIHSPEDSLLFNLIPNSEYNITICVNDNPECCWTVTVLTEVCDDICACLDETEISNVNAECQDDGNYIMTFAMVSLCDTVVVTVNYGEQHIIYGEGTYTIDNIEAIDEPNISICLFSNPNCCAFLPWDQPQCFDTDDPVEQLVGIAVKDSEIVVETEIASSIGLIDIGGRLVRSHGLEGNTHRINTTGLSTGIYLVNIIEPRRIVSKKVFISN